MDFEKNANLNAVRFNTPPALPAPAGVTDDVVHDGLRHARNLAMRMVGMSAFDALVKANLTVIPTALKPLLRLQGEERAAYLQKLQPSSVAGGDHSQPDNSSYSGTWVEK